MKPTCLKNVWDIAYQELLVVKYGHEVQTMKAECETKKPTGDERIGDTSKYLIK